MSANVIEELKAASSSISSSTRWRHVAGLVRGHVTQSVHLQPVLRHGSCGLFETEQSRVGENCQVNLAYYHVFTLFLSSDTMGGGEMPYKIPDWKVYQVGKHTPELEQVQRMLSSLGLKVGWSSS